MSNKIIHQVNQYYSKKIMENGATPQGVDWNSTESQELRFEVLSNVISDSEAFSVLDYGCGFGSMCDYFKKKYASFHFTGIDISEEMIKEAVKRNAGDKNAAFTTALNPDALFDYVIASGIFNVRLDNPNEEWLAYILETIHTLNVHAKKGFSFNVLTKYSDKEYMKDYLYYADPLFLFDHCKKHFSRNVALLHDYNLYEFYPNCKKTMKEKIVLFGTGDIAQIANYYFDIDSKYEVVAFTVDKDYCKETMYEGKPLVPFEDIERSYPPAEYKMFIALSYAQMNKLREKKYHEAKAKGYGLVSYISSRCSYLSQFQPGDNCFIFEDNTIQPFVKIGSNVTFWSGNHIGHHSIIESHNFISSHVVVSGHCHIEPHCFIGVNSTLGHQVKIGRESLIGAGAIITKNTEEKSVYVPAKSVKLDKTSDMFKL